jgi:hypothetical protein
MRFGHNALDLFIYLFWISLLTSNHLLVRLHYIVVRLPTGLYLWVHILVVKVCNKASQPILEIHLGNTMLWFMWGSNLFWWLSRHPFTWSQLGHLLCCWRCTLSIANFCLCTHLVVCSLGLWAWVVGLTTWVVRTATRCVTFASGPFQ